MFSKIFILLCIVIALSSAVPAGGGWGGNPWTAAGGNGLAPGGNPFIPPWVAQAPWFPQWTPCTVIGSSCVDCTTKQVCTKIGGIQRACADPTLPYCNLGECSATPSAECQPSTTVPAETA
ncbi:unnamed protein product [Diatraea saccharalis]|uniref:Uncharacterized protein n=1 Tax=Diatraea saccharalis TaxID=40085 RepID=A0A9N9R2G3_9NEOP|nr:unnamed protein product [Diatraea saccharalis]